jgi:hypothetical protein
MGSWHGIQHSLNEPGEQTLTTHWPLEHPLEQYWLPSSAQEPVPSQKSAKFAVLPEQFAGLQIV